MKITFISLSDNLGGAAVVTRRLAGALRGMGHDVTMLVGHKTTDCDWIEEVSPQWLLKSKFLRERLGIFMCNGFDRGDLFKVSTACCGMPLDRHPAVIGADVAVLGWFNQGLLSLEGIADMLRSGKKLAWMMHDLWAMTGICHHPGECQGYKGRCGRCAFLHRKAGVDDLSHKIWLKKKALYDNNGGEPIFLPVSKWVAERARSSSLLKGRRIEVLHNGLDLSSYGRCAKYGRKTLGLPEHGKILLMAAARLDDPIKCLPKAIDALNILYDTPAGGGVTAVFAGDIREQALLDNLRMPHICLGLVKDADKMESLFVHADVVVSSSAYETLGETLCEGMACGAVPVAYDSGGQSDVIDHLETGYLARPGDVDDLARGMAWALATPIDKGKLKAAAGKFDMPAIAKRFVDLISKLERG